MIFICTDLVLHDSLTGQLNPNMEVEEAINLVLSQHKRYVSKLQGVFEEMTKYFEDEESLDIAKSIMREKYPLATNLPTPANTVELKYIIIEADRNYIQRHQKLQALARNGRPYFTDGQIHKLWLDNALRYVDTKSIVCYWLRTHLGEELDIEHVIAPIVCQYNTSESNEVLDEHTENVLVIDHEDNKVDKDDLDNLKK